MYVIGGAFGDSTGVLTFFNDIFAFDVNRMVWLPMSVQGSVLPGWSGLSFVTTTGDLIYVTSCATDVDPTVWLLEIGRRVMPSDCFVQSLPQTVTSNETFTFQIAAIDAATDSIISAATNLKLSGTLFQIDGLGLSSVPVDIESNNDGTYAASATLLYGSKYRLDVALLDSDDASPFIQGSSSVITLAPGKLSVAKTKIFGIGAQEVIQGDTATLLLEFLDEFSNWYPLNSTVFESLSIALLETTENQPIEILRAVLLDNGTVSIVYHVPSIDSFDISVVINATVIDTIHPDVYTPLAVDHILRIAVIIISCLIIFSVTLSNTILIIYRRTKVARATSIPFTSMMCFGLVVVCCGVISFASQTTIGCRLYPYFGFSGFVITVATIVFKTKIIETIFRSKSLKGIQVNFKRQLLIPPILSMLITAIIAVREALYPTSLAKILVPNQSVRYYYDCSTNGDASTLLFVAFGFCGALLCYAVYLARRVQEVPEEHNESKLIASTVYNITVIGAVLLITVFALKDTGRYSQFSIYPSISLLSHRLFFQSQIQRSESNLLESSGAVHSLGVSQSSHARTIHGTKLVNRRSPSLPR